MATDDLWPDEARALRTIEAIYGGPEDVDDDPPLDPARIARMRASIDDAFARAQAARDRAAANDPRAHRPGLLALAGDGLRARIAALRALLGAELLLAHRSLADMSDDDLRSLLADLEEYAEHKGLVP